jgi:hypothetical protein
MDVIDVEDRLRALRRLPVAAAPPVGELAGRGERPRGRQRAVAIAAAALVAIVVVGLLLDPKDEETTVQTAAEPPTSGPPTTMSAEAATEAWDQAMVAELIAFASQPSDETFDDLSLAPWVMLGIDGRGVATKPRDELRDPSAWVVDGHSALDTLATADDYILTLGDHKTCNGEDYPLPPEMTGYRRLGIQRPKLKDDTCLDWYAVDLVLHDGLIVGISLTLWEY